MALPRFDFWPGAPVVYPLNILPQDVFAWLALLNAVALVLTAVIFSFIHFQFEGFLPRMLLGLLLGWLYWRTGNFWVPVAAHFANNGAQVLGQFLYKHDLSSIDMEEDVDIPWYAAAISVLLIWWIMRTISSRQLAAGN